MSTACRIRVGGHLDAYWAGRLPGLVVEHRPDGTSTLTGRVLDQAGLHGVLAVLRDLGVPLLSVDTEAAVASDPLVGVQWPRATDRLTIRRAVAADAGATFAFRRRDEVARWLTALPDDAERYAASFATPERLATTLVVERGGRVVGDLMVRVEDAWAQAEVERGARGRQAELAWVLDPGWAGHGYATEAVRELLVLCFEDLALHRVVATCFAENVASWRLMERVGLRRELHARADALHRSGEWMDTYGYALTAAEWRRGSPTGSKPQVSRPVSGHV